jgi:hypothetical protein
MIESYLLYGLVLTSIPTLILVTMMFRQQIRKQASTTSSKQSGEGLALQLQALERLTLFAERSTLKNLLGRTAMQGLSAADLHQLLTETIRQEYEYNLSQQIYVSPELWNAITRLKDQNIYIIHHITASLPPQAGAMDLSRLILEYTETPNAEMSAVVLDALQFEAKKLMQ